MNVAYVKPLAYTVIKTEREVVCMFAGKFKCLLI